MKSVRAVVARFGEADGAHRDELAFLPAALEIVETPPPPLAGAIGATIIALFCAALIWAVLGQIDIVATAPGQDHTERPHQGDSAVRNRRRSRHPRPRWAERQSRRCSDRT